MLEVLSHKLTAAFRKISSKGTLSEKDIKATLREVRLALLEADVDYNVVRQFSANVLAKAVGDRVFYSLTPGQAVIKIVQEELTATLGHEHQALSHPYKRPTVIMLVGLQGAGKTTAAAKLASYLTQREQTCMLAACDLQRPAAIEQLKVLGSSLGVPVFHDPRHKTAVNMAKAALQDASKLQPHYLILDTAGRQAIDMELMNELNKVKQATEPTEILLAVDAMVGQDAVRSSAVFHQALTVSGVILTKMDGDARGGAALSLSSALNVPIKFVTTGEKPHQIEEHHPKRLASRILGMGDVETLIERAQKHSETLNSKDLERRLYKRRYDLNDFLKQMESVQKMGSISDMLGMIPGMGNLKGQISDTAAEKNLHRTQAVIQSMTMQERTNPELIKASRRRRIAAGSGTSPAQVNQVLAQHNQFRKMMKRFKGKSSSRLSLAGLFR